MDIALALLGSGLSRRTGSGEGTDGEQVWWKQKAVLPGKGSRQPECDRCLLLGMLPAEPVETDQHRLGSPVRNLCANPLELDRRGQMIDAHPVLDAKTIIPPGPQFGKKFAGTNDLLCR